MPKKKKGLNLTSVIFAGCVVLVPLIFFFYSCFFVLESSRLWICMRLSDFNPYIFYHFVCNFLWFSVFLATCLGVS